MNSIFFPPLALSTVIVYITRANFSYDLIPVEHFYYEPFALLLQVILATNIAESSVTIPGVAYVIDSCRSLQVYWDSVRKTDSAGLVWASKSQVSLTNILMILILKPTFDPEACNYFLTSYRLSSGKAGRAEPVMVKYIAW